MEKAIKLFVAGVCLLLIFFIGKSKLAELYYGQGNERYEQKLYKEAAEYFNKALKMYPSSAAIHYALANAYREEGAESKAIAEYRKAVELDEHYIEAYQALVRGYLGQGAHKEALALVQKAEDANPSDPDIKALKKEASFESFVDAGMGAFEKGEGMEARESLKDALAVDPDSATAHYMLATSFYEKRDYYRAEDHLKEALRLEPRFYLAHTLLGDIYFGKGEFEKAIGEYEASLAQEGADAAVHNSIGMAYMNLEKYGQAIPPLQKALALAPDNVDIRHNLAAVFRDRGMLDQAAEELLNVIRAKPDFPNAHNDLGDIYKKQGKNEEAAKQYQASIDSCQKRFFKNPGDSFVLAELAYAYSGAGDYDRARQVGEKAVAINPNDAKAYFTLARIYQNLNRPDLALIALDKANKLSSQKYLYIQDAIAGASEQWAKKKR